MTSIHFTLYSAIVLLSLNGLFANGVPLDAASMIHVRSIVAGITLALFINFTKGCFQLDRKKTTATVYLVGFLMGLHWITFFYAMQTTSVAIGMLSLYTFPIMTCLFEPFFTGKKIQRFDLVLSLLALVGLYIMARNHLPSINDHSNNDIIIGIASGVLSAFFFSLRNLLQKYRCPHISSDTLMFHQVIIIAIMMLFIMDFSALQQLPNQYWFYLVLLGVVTTALAHTLLVKSYKNFSATTVSMTSCAQPVIGSLFAWMILGETLTLSTIIGGSIILSIAIYESTKTSTHD